MAQNNRRRQRQPDSTPAIERKVVLHSREAQDIFNRYYQRAAYDLIYIGIVARLRGEHETASAVETEFGEWLKEAQEKLKSEKARLEAALEDAGLDPSMVSYSAPKEVTARITSPQAGQFFGLVEGLDTILQTIDTLWLGGEVDNNAKVQLMQQWRNSIRKIAERIRHTANAARKRMNQAESAAAAQEAKQQTGLDEADVTEAEEETAESGADNAITYRHPDDPDKTWSGKGRTPKWIQEWEQQGGDREALRA